MEFFIGNPYRQRVVRTISFIDLSGFTLYTQTKGDEAAVEALMGFRAITRECCARRGVRIAKWLGDGAMLVSLESELVAEAVTEIRTLIDSDEKSPLRLRAGVATGPVILFEGDDHVGSVVNLAARLCDIASEGQVLAPRGFVSALMVNTNTEDMGSVSIRGFDEPIEVVALTEIEPFEYSLNGRRKTLR